MHSAVTSILFVFAYTHDILETDHVSQHSSQLINESKKPEFKSFEEINAEVFMKRVVSVNHTEETINGKRIKYYVTDTGDWHLDSCTVIGNNDVGLIGLYYEMTDQRRRLNPYVANSDGLGSWEGGTVPYVIEHPSLNMANWNAAVAHYTAVSPIRLVDYTNVKPRPQYYIRVFQGSGCFGTLGRVNEYWTTQPNYQGNSLSLGQGCDGWLPTIVHEIGHNLGFHHTQKRNDRNSYIDVNYDNIIETYWSQYDIVNVPVCGDYDCRSVMHYFDTAFGNGNGKTMVPKNPNSCVIQRDTYSPLSYWDKQCLCQLYPPGVNGHAATFCGGTPNPTPKPSISPTKTITNNPTKRPTVNPTVTVTNSPTFNSDDFCLRGRGLSGTNLYINGNYIKQDYNDNYGNVYYKNDRVSCKLTAYIYKYTRNYFDKESETFYSATVWAINRELNAGAPVAICTESDIFDCDQKWVFGQSYDTNLRLTRGTCPTVPCQILKVSDTDTGCDGKYTEEGDNYYSNDDFTLIYNDFYEQYRCIENDNIDYINSCDEYDGIRGSEYGIMPEVTNNLSNSVSIPWSGPEGTQARLQCIETTTTTPAPTTGVRPTIDCDNSIYIGSIPQYGSKQIDWVAESKNYAYIFYTCYQETNFDTNIVVKTQNLENTIKSNDYSNTYCPDTPWKQVILLWKSSSEYKDMVTYTLDITGNNEEYGTFKIEMFCYNNQNEALNFGKNEDDMYVPIFSFRLYGKVQWAIFFGVVAGCIIINILIIWFIVRKLVKKKEKTWKSKSEQIELNNNNHIQTNITISPDGSNTPTGL